MEKLDDGTYLADDGEAYRVIGKIDQIVFLARIVDYFRDVVQVYATSSSRLNEANAQANFLTEKGDD